MKLIEAFRQQKLSKYYFKVLPPVCMKLTVPGESRVANIAQSRMLYLS